MTHSVPFLTLLILLPAVGRGRARPARPGPRLHRELAYALALIVSLVTAVFAVAAWWP